MIVDHKEEKHKSSSIIGYTLKKKNLYHVCLEKKLNNVTIYDRCTVYCKNKTDPRIKTLIIIAETTE